MRRVGFSFFLGACAFVGGTAGTVILSQINTVHADPRRPQDIQLLSESFEQVARRVSPTVVAIEAVKSPAANSPNAKSKPVEESGSGVLIRFEGMKGTLVITNNHVISGAKAEQITVNLADNRLLKPIKVWADPESDIACLLLDIDNLPTANFADSDRIRVGQFVLAFGSPFGLNQTVTHGIISAKERGQVSLGTTIRIKEFLQTDAAINPGSSGGPLLNLDGEIVGINTAIASHSGSNSGVAFSIPSNLVKRIAKQLVERGSVTRGYLGVQLSGSIDPNDALRLGMSKSEGALVEAVYPETPAASAGLRANDVILKVDDVIIKSDNHLINLISALPAGQKVKLQLWRDKKSIVIEAIVGDWERAQARLKASPMN
ncbi:trypsin-like peptidase domain-containing protein [Telmatocola sphagniphila]|uniref:Trypsin-like peptidase domain-containing protein n=1 Tax=Telmatocola sphagniphila TaxID=1123043 RepID=A0A8E6B1Q2_9BACT|nr:trypsin-like peptidase domain-containing protein [Telmatocola sphagniphila]QVL30420.1 trypsin-like peptidase domain-containing protein [Telmatocola sphagniphila]